jgi:hypothetical protein
MVQFQVSDDVEWRAVENEVVVLDLRTQLYLSFNDTGAALWRGVADGASIDELAARLAAEFAVDEAVAARDALAFVGDLVQRGLIREHNAGLDSAR